MDEQSLKKRIDNLLYIARYSTKISSSQTYELFQGALTVMTALHGSDSIQVQTLVKNREEIIEQFGTIDALEYLNHLAIGSLENMKAEIESGLGSNLQRTIAGAVITDFIQLAHHTLDNDNTDDAKNVASVLAASVYEDTIRRLAITKGRPHQERLADVINDLKDNNILQGAQVGIANSYLSFRNKALHAQWDKVDRASVASVLGFVEGLLLQHFS